MKAIPARRHLKASVTVGNPSNTQSISRPIGGFVIEQDNGELLKDEKGKVLFLQGMAVAKTELSFE